MMQRHTFVAGMAAVMVAPLAGEAQQTVYRIAYLSPAAGPTPLTDAFDRRLRAEGFVIGHNISVDRRYMAGREKEYTAVLAELEHKADVIVVAGPPAALAAKKTITKVPVVFSAVGDPVAIGLVQSLAKPGGNLTGVGFDVTPEIAGKRLEVLKEAIPKVARVGALWSSADPVGVPALRQLDTAASRLRVSVIAHDVRVPEDFEGIFRAIVTDRADALLVVGGPVNVIHRGRIIDFAAKQRLPAIYISSIYVDEGGLMSYGPSFSDNIERAAVYVARILKGAKPSDLPVELPTKLDLAINLKTAKALGLTIPPSLLLRADQVIDP